ncbi:hypothetical protein ACJQWK_06523 [Exserohilum turcicum]
MFPALADILSYSSTSAFVHSYLCLFGTTALFAAFTFVHKPPEHIGFSVTSVRSRATLIIRSVNLAPSASISASHRLVQYVRRRCKIV